MSQYIVEDTRKVTTTRLRQMKAEGKRIAMLTAYDYTTASIVDGAGVDMILIGDSAANVMHGYATTLPITLDEMIFHARAVARATKRAFVVCDMPFGSYQVNADDGVRAAARIMKETGCDGVKLEGGVEIIDTVRRIIAAGIPVCGHLGLTPQSVNQFGGYGLRAKGEAEAAKLLSDTKLLSDVGCCAIVVEKIPAALTRKAMEVSDAPIIGIGGGPADGQVLVVDDMLGKNKGFTPKFLRRYADLHTIMTDAIGRYVSDVKDGSFPSAEESY